MGTDVPSGPRAIGAGVNMAETDYSRIIVAILRLRAGCRCGR